MNEQDGNNIEDLRPVMIKQIARVIAQNYASIFTLNSESESEMLSKVFDYARRIEYDLYLQQGQDYIFLLKDKQLALLLEENVESFFYGNPDLVDIQMDNTERGRPREDSGSQARPSKKSMVKRSAQEVEPKPKKKKERRSRRTEFFDEINHTFSTLFGKFHISGRKRIPRQKISNPPFDIEREKIWLEKLGRNAMKSAKYTALFIVPGSAKRFLKNGVLWQNSFLKYTCGERTVQNYMRSLPPNMYSICKGGMYVLKLHLEKKSLGHPVTFNTELKVKKSTGKRIIYSHNASTVHVSEQGRVYMLNRSWPMQSKNDAFCISAKTSASTVVVRPYNEYIVDNATQIVPWKISEDNKNFLMTDLTDAQKREIERDFETPLSFKNHVRFDFNSKILRGDPTTSNSVTKESSELSESSTLQVEDPNALLGPYNGYAQNISQTNDRHVLRPSQGLPFDYAAPPSDQANFQRKESRYSDTELLSLIAGDDPLVPMAYGSETRNPLAQTSTGRGSATSIPSLFDPSVVGNEPMDDPFFMDTMTDDGVATDDSIYHQEEDEPKQSRHNSHNKQDRQNQRRWM